MKEFKFFKRTYPTKKDLDNAFMLGYTHHLEGRERTYNPYFDNQTYEKWNQGWRWADTISRMSKIED